MEVSVMLFHAGC